MDNVIFRLGVFVPVLLISTAFHEVAHGYVAYLLGDNTAKNAGRLTLNPLVHIDPMGAMVMVITSLLGFGIGWAKPVPIQPSYFKDPSKGMMLVSLGGPGANLVIAFIFNLLIKLIIALDVALPGKLLEMLGMIVLLNLVLAAFNLIPIPPMDGSRIVGYLLPRQYKMQWYMLDRYGMIFVIILAVTKVLYYVMIPIAKFLAFVIWADPIIKQYF